MMVRKKPRLWLAGLAGFFLSLPNSSLHAQGTTETSGGLSFAIADSREARDLFKDAEEHFQSERWTQGLVKLQKIIDEHPNDLLPATGDTKVFLGAAAHAENRIGKLPEQGRASYETHYGNLAKAFLEEAKAKKDSVALTKLVQRYGRTRAGESASILLGDMALEKGDLIEAEQNYLKVWKQHENDSRESELYLRLGWVYRLNKNRQGFESLKPFPQRDVSFLGEKQSLDSVLERWKEETPITIPSSNLVGGFKASSADSLPSEPNGIEQVAWRFPEENAFQRPFYPPKGFSNPIFNLHPVVDEDSVLVSDSISVFAIDLYSGRERWKFPGASGWERVSESEKKSDFFGNGVNPNGTVAGASSQGICIFSLQVPLKIYEKKEFQGIPIKTVIPTRRLFAFDIASGKLLWSHWRAELAKLGVGDFTDATSVAAPPIVIGDRVYAPIYRMEGKIDYYIACFELRTGRMLWKTPVVTGQLELNMFGRPICEFAGSPLLYQDGNIYCSTNLGVIASVEARQGRLRWVSMYDVIAIRPTMSYNRNLRSFYWENQPPAFCENTLFITPLDSEYLYPVNFETGEMLGRFHYNNGLNRQTRTKLQHLLGAANGKVYLSGAYLVALAAREGLGVPRFEAVWAKPVTPNLSSTSDFPRGEVTDRSVLIPTLDGILSFALNDGNGNGQIASWQVNSRDRGNLTVDEGITFSLSDVGIEARFDWQNLLQKNRREASSGDNVALERLGRLLKRRGDTLSQGNFSELEQAIPLYTEAGEILEKLARSGHEGINKELYELYLSVGDLENRRANPILAESSYRKAKQWAHLPNFRLQATLKLSDLLKEQGSREAFEGVLAELDRDFGTVRARIPKEGEIPIGLHVLLSRLHLYLSKNENPQALQILQEMLKRYPNEPLDFGLVSDFARNSIAALIQSQGRGIYEEYEAEAEKQLSQALANKDRDSLFELTRLYPNALAVSKANRSLIEISLSERDTATVVTLCRRYVLENPKDSGAAFMMRRMAAAFSYSGNEDLSQAILRKLAKDFPELNSDYPQDFSKKFSELVRERKNPEPITSPRPPLSPETDVNVAYNSLLVLHPVGEDLFRKGYFLSFADNELRCYRPADPKGLEKPLWRIPGNPEDPTEPLTAFFGKTLTIGFDQTLQGVEIETGKKLWSRNLKGRLMDSQASQGVLFCISREKRESFVCEAIDAVSGVLLWSLDLNGEIEMPRWIFGEDSLVFLPIGNNNAKSLPVYNLFTGLVQSEVSPPRISDILSGVISQDVLLLAYAPSVQRTLEPEERASLVRGIPLRGNKNAWKFPLPQRFIFHSFLVAQNKPYLVLISRDTRDAEGGMIYTISAEEGNIADLQSLPQGVIFPGLLSRPEYVNSIEESEFLFLYPDIKGFLKGTLFDLKSGKTVWKRSLPQPAGQVYDRGSFPAAIFSSELLLLPIKINRPNGNGARTEVMVLDRKTAETVSTAFSLMEGSDEDLDIIALPELLVIQQGTQLRKLAGSTGSK